MRMVMCLQISTIISTGGRTTSLLLNVYNVSDFGQIEVHMVEPLVPDPSRLELESAMES
jgi:hypothetical protein